MNIAVARARELRQSIVALIEQSITDPGAVVGKRWRGESRDHWAARAVVETITPSKVPMPPDKLSREKVWQPIETAPRDGRSIIVALRDFADGWIVGEAYFNSDDSGSPGAQQWWWANQDWSDYYATSIDEGNQPPTHWMPLPDPPRSRS